TNEGGPKEIVEHNVTGLVLADHSVDAWCTAIAELLDDEPRRMLMSRAAAGAMSARSLSETFDSFWSDHLAVVEPPSSEDESLTPTFQKTDRLISPKPMH